MFLSLYGTYTKNELTEFEVLTPCPYRYIISTCEMK